MTGIEGLIKALKERPDTFYSTAKITMLSRGVSGVVDYFCVDTATGFYFKITHYREDESDCYKSYLCKFATKVELELIIQLLMKCDHSPITFNLDSVYGANQ